MNQQSKEVLQRYFPQQTIDQVSGWLVKYAVQLKVTRGRITKLGDFRPAGKTRYHRISVNGDLNKYFFYLVFVHELAHLLVWNKYGRKVTPHGQQWKEEFGSLLKQAVYNQYLPDELVQPVLDFSTHVKATFAADNKLWKALRSFDENPKSEITIDQIPFESYFLAANGKLFKKEEKLRTRFRCSCIVTRRKYLFHPMAVIIPIHKNELPKKVNI
jgi:hypothetical protein